MLDIFIFYTNVIMSTLNPERKCMNCWIILQGTKRKFCSRKCKSAFRNKTLVERVCENCWTHFMGPYRSIACSDECRKVLKNKTYKENFIAKYWVDNPSKLKSSREKFKQTMIEKYWVEHPSQSKELIERQHRYFLDKYWVDNPMKIKDIAKKSTLWTIQTNMERYWVPYYVMTQDCREANNIISKPNLFYTDLLESYWYKVEKEFPLEHYSYDLKIWDTLIEINPFPYHNSTWSPVGDPTPSDYHYNKLKLARDNGFRCVMIWDWDNYSKIPYLLEENKQQLYARKCEVKQITREECHNFFESYHLQGDTVKNKNNIYIWLYYNNELVECMSFWLPRYNKNYEREILRLCTHKDYRVVWWADKIFKHFLELTNANSVISYCDMSKFDWKVYEQLGFKLLKWNKPSKHWYNEKEVESRKHITDNLLRQRWYDQIFGESYGKGTNNDELMKQRGYVEIYDCGQATFIWTKS